MSNSEAFLRLMHAAVDGIPSSIYNALQKDKWKAQMLTIDWEDRLKKQHLFTREHKGQLSAFGTLKGNEIDFLFVAPEYQKQGLATSLLQQIENLARKKALKELTIKASKALFPLCLKLGYTVNKIEEVEMDGVALKRFAMVKPLHHLRHTSRTLWTSSRLYFREMLPIDAETCYLLNQDWEVMKYTGDVAFRSIEESRKFLENYDPYKKEGLGRWAILDKENGAYLGWCGLKRREDGQVDLGYRFHRKNWNKGYATESSRLCIQKAKEQFHLKELILEAHKDNGASRQVAVKLGFQLTESAEHAERNDVFYTLQLKD